MASTAPTNPSNLKDTIQPPSTGVATNNNPNPEQKKETKPSSKPKNAHALLKTLPPPPAVIRDNKTGKVYTTGDWLGEVEFYFLFIYVNRFFKKTLLNLYSEIIFV